jgi:hypothetical protein
MSHLFDIMFYLLLNCLLLIPQQHVRLSTSFTITMKHGIRNVLTEQNTHISEDEIHMHM